MKEPSPKFQNPVRPVVGRIAALLATGYERRERRLFSAQENPATLPVGGDARAIAALLRREGPQPKRVLRLRLEFGRNRLENALRELSAAQTIMVTPKGRMTEISLRADQ